MSDSPIAQLLTAIDALDLDGAVALVGPDCELLTADGRRAEGRDAVRGLLGDFLSSLRSAAHRVTAEWHLGDVWIAEVEATYELQDWMKTSPLPRAFIVRDGAEGLAEVHVYGAHERRLTDHRTGREGIWIGDRWIPPL